jgi:3-methyl-2-oxobutanoate hydroxymethyltransferase
MSSSKRSTVADMLALKGQRQITMLYVDTLDEAAAAAAAGIDMLSIIQPVWTAEMRAAAGACFVQVGLLYGELCTYEDYLRAAHAAMRVGGDCCYCAAGLDTVRGLRAEGIPVIGHVGLTPQAVNILGGYGARGREAQEAKKILADAKAVDDAGAFCIVVEGVMEGIATDIARSVAAPVIGIGASAECDGQVLVTEDMLGLFERTPRFVKRFDDLASRIGEAAGAYAAEVRERRFPTADQTYRPKA